MQEKEMNVVPGLAGIPAAESGVSFVDGEKGKLFYRGIPIKELTKNSTFLETSYLLIYDKLPKKKELNNFVNDIKYHTRLKYKILRMMEHLPENGHPMDYLQSVVAAMGMYYPARNVLDAETRRLSVIKLIAKMPTIVAACHRMRHGDAAIDPDNSLSYAANFYYMMFERKPDKFTEKLIDVLLILHGDHTMNASTFSSRVVGSTLADPYTIVSAAIGTLSGPLHGGANEEVLKMLNEIGEPKKARAFIENKIKNKEKIMGVGHRIYKTKDPRAKILQEFAHKLFKKTSVKESNLLKTAEAVEKVVYEKLAPKGLYPNVDFYSGIVFKELGIPADLFTSIFAMGRVSGWLAHWEEQLKTNRIYRPTQKYTGTLNKKYKPLKNRG